LAILSAAPDGWHKPRGGLTPNLAWHRFYKLKMCPDTTRGDSRVGFMPCWAALYISVFRSINNESPLSAYSRKPHLRYSLIAWLSFETMRLSF
jgi:hypothetical protein